MTRSHAQRHKTRLQLTSLEERQNPALHVSNLFGNLMITGTPDALANVPAEGWSEKLSVTRVGPDRFQVTDGPTALGTYSHVKNISIRLDDFDNNIVIDLAGGRLRGDVMIDLGAGDRDPDSNNLVVIGGAGGAIQGSVTILGTASSESLFVGSDLLQESFSYEINGEMFTFYSEYTVDTPLTVKSDVIARGHPVTTPVEDNFYLGLTTSVGRDLITDDLSYVFISGAVKRDIIARAEESPGGMGLTLQGHVGRNLTARAGATEPGYSSYFSNYGTVGRDLTIDVQAGNSVINLAPDNGEEDSSIGRDVIITTPQSGDVSTTIFVESEIGRHLKIHDGDGDLFVRLGAKEVYLDPFTGNVIYEYIQSFHVGGHVIINAGNGDNALVLADAPGTSICGKLLYWGGSSGTDAITIDSRSSIRMYAHLGGGDNTVTFAPTAKMGSALITYKASGGTTTITPPNLIDFPFFVIPV